MESTFSKFPKVTDFNISQVCACKYDFPKDFLWKMLCSLCDLLINCRKELLSIT
jgi:hypothetical protein